MDNLETMTPDQAAAKIADLKGNEDFVTKYLAGSGPQVAEMRELIKVAQSSNRGKIADDVLGGKQSPESIFLDPQRRDAEQTVEVLRGLGIHEESVARSVLTDSAVSVAERQQAAAAKDRLMKDQDFVKKFLAGDGDARRQMGLLNVILTRGVKASA